MENPEDLEKMRSDVETLEKSNMAKKSVLAEVLADFQNSQIQAESEKRRKFVKNVMRAEICLKIDENEQKRLKISAKLLDSYRFQSWTCFGVSVENLEENGEIIVEILGSTETRWTLSDKETSMQNLETLKPRSTAHLHVAISNTEFFGAQKNPEIILHFRKCPENSGVLSPQFCAEVWSHVEFQTICLKIDNPTRQLFLENEFVDEYSAIILAKCIQTCWPSQILREKMRISQFCQKCDQKFRCNDFETWQYLGGFGEFSEICAILADEDEIERIWAANEKMAREFLKIFEQK